MKWLISRGEGGGGGGGGGGKKGGESQVALPLYTSLSLLLYLADMNGWKVNFLRKKIKA